MPRRLLQIVLASASLLAGTAARPVESLRDPTRPYAEPVTATTAAVRFKVSAIFVSDERRVAVVNGQRVMQGDLVDGATVIEILSDELRLDYRGEAIITRLAGSGLRKQE